MRTASSAIAFWDAWAIMSAMPDWKTTWTIHGAARDINFLRMQSESLRFGSAELNFGGVDYQPFKDRDHYIPGAETLIRPGAVNILLSHNPDVFPTAARQGWDVTLAGHTHGGQVTVEILNQTLNVARIYTRYVSGFYQIGPFVLLRDAGHRHHRNSGSHRRDRRRSR